MFQLHDTTRRRICATAFMALGVLPATLVGGWCLSRHLPGYVQAEAQQLSRQLGLSVTLGDVQHLRPGVVLYDHLKIADPETGKTVLRCRWLEIARQQSSDSQARPAVVMTASQPEVEAAALGRVWQCLQRALEGSFGSFEADLHFSAAELTLQASQDSQTLTEVNGAVENLTGGTHAQLDFRLAGTDASEPARIRVVRNRQISPPASGFELDTGGSELPCSLLALGLDELRPLGPRCRFLGRIGATETPDGWQGDVTGHLVELDLGKLVSEHFPHKLTGMGEATILSARFYRGRLEEGSAILTAGPGKIDRSLMAAAVDHLGLVPAVERVPVGDLMSYDQLAFLATLDAQGLRLGGRCTDAEKGTILSCRGSRLLGESPQQPAPVVAMVRTLVSQSAVQVPASRQTDRLLHYLPVPDIMPPPGAEPVPLKARNVRVGKTLR